jgi:hypothetical protein
MTSSDEVDRSEAASAAEPGSLLPPVGDEPPGDDPGAEKDEPPAATTGPASVRLVPAKTSYAVGEQIVLNVAMENGGNVGSVPFHLRYTSDVLQFLPPASEGPFMGADGTSTVFLASDVAGGGEVVVGLSRLGGTKGAFGSGVLATFQFMAVAPGDAGFAFTGASVKGPQAGNLPASFSVLPVRVEP